jgi:hypothetical protein
VAKVHRQGWCGFARGGIATTNSTIIILIIRTEPSSARASCLNVGADLTSRASTRHGKISTFLRAP